MKIAYTGGASWMLRSGGAWYSLGGRGALDLSFSSKTGQTNSRPDYRMTWLITLGRRVSFGGLSG